MLDILKSFEQVATRFSPIVLVLPGLIMTVLGLFIWLGGLGFQRLLRALVGAVSGGVCALVAADLNVAIAAVAALVAAFLAAFFQRVFAAALLGVLAFAIVFLVMARPYLRDNRGSLMGGQGGAGGPPLTVGESLDVVRAFAIDVQDNVKYAARQLPPLSWAIIVAVGAGLLMLGQLFRHLGGALSCAVLGTLLVFAGLVALLALKGSAPVTRIGNRAPFYGLAFIAMIAFGTIEQLLLCSHADRRSAQTHSENAEQKKGRSKRSWRGQ